MTGSCCWLWCGSSRRRRWYSCRLSVAGCQLERQRRRRGIAAHDSEFVHVGDPVAEECQDEACHGEGDLLAAEVAFPAKGHAGGEGDSEGQAGEKSADVGRVVDMDAEVDDDGAESDDKVDGGELDDARSQALQLTPGEGEAAVGDRKSTRL